MRVTIVYDGKCPACSRLVAASRLRSRASKLELVDARTESLDSIQGKNLSGLDFNEGFAVVVDQEVHHGAQAAHVLSLLTEPTGLGHRLFRWLTRTPARSTRWYPLMKAGRRLLLFVLRIPRINTRKS